MLIFEWPKYSSAGAKRVRADTAAREEARSTVQRNAQNMKRTITVAAVQLPAHDIERFDDVWASVRAHVRDAAKNGADIVVLPEGTIPAYIIGRTPLDTERIDRAVADLRSDAAALRVLAVCGIGRTHASFQYNSAVVVDSDGTVAGFADKAFLWHFDRRWFAPAEAIAPVATSLGTLGALVCADGRMPAIARALVDGGAEFLTMPTAWVTSGRDPAALENIQADLLARVRARENGVPFVAANKSGVERGCVAYCGKSQIVDAEGAVLAIAPENAPAIVASEVVVGGPVAPRVPPAPVAAREREDQYVRIALAMDARDAAGAADLLEAGAVLGAGATGDHPVLDDADVLDPGCALRYRRAGHRLLIWRSAGFDAAWIVPFARARALELRVFVAVFDEARGRAFAVDPDGAVVAGTFGALRATSFVFDPARTRQTLVAPGTDVAAGIERIATLTGDARA